MNIQEVRPYFVVEPGIFSDMVNSFNVEVVKRKKSFMFHVSIFVKLRTIIFQDSKFGDFLHTLHFGRL